MTGHYGITKAPISCSAAREQRKLDWEDRAGVIGTTLRRRRNCLTFGPTASPKPARSISMIMVFFNRWRIYDRLGQGFRELLA